MTSYINPQFPDDPALSIRFMLRVDKIFYGESVIPKYLTEIQQAVATDIIYMPAPDGAVSIAYNGEELLGIEFWDAIDNINPIPNQLLTNNDTTMDLPMQTVGVHLHRQGDELVYHVASYSPKRSWNVRRVLPLALFIQQWTLMRLRYNRLRAYLGSEKANRQLAGFKDFMSQEWRDMVGVENINLVLEEDLEILFFQSSFPDSYVYDTASGEFQPATL